MYSTAGIGAWITAGAGESAIHHWRWCSVHGRSGRDVLFHRCRCSVHGWSGRDVLHHRCRCRVHAWSGRDVHLHWRWHSVHGRSGRDVLIHGRRRAYTARVRLLPLALTPQTRQEQARRKSLLAKPLVLERCTPPLALVGRLCFA